jgi:hypothetical protein
LFEVGVALHDGPVRDASGDKSTASAKVRTVRERTYSYAPLAHQITKHVEEPQVDFQ